MKFLEKKKRKETMNILKQREEDTKSIKTMLKIPRKNLRSISKLFKK